MRYVVVRIDLIERHIPRFELHALVGSCAYGLEIVWGVARLLAFVLGKEMFGQDQPSTAKKSVVPEGRGLLKDHLDSMVIELVDVRDARVAASRGRPSGRVRRKFPGEDNVIGGKGLTIVPHHVLFEFPGDRHTILGQP